MIDNESEGYTTPHREAGATTELGDERRPSGEHTWTRYVAKITRKATWANDQTGEARQTNGKDYSLEFLLISKISEIAQTPQGRRYRLEK